VLSSVSALELWAQVMFSREIKMDSLVHEFRKDAYSDEEVDESMRGNDLTSSQARTEVASWRCSKKNNQLEFD
jgi:hypothetical protein